MQICKLDDSDGISPSLQLVGSVIYSGDQFSASSSRCEDGL